MITIRKVSKFKLPKLYDFKLRYVLPLKNSKEEKLKAIKEINENLKNDYKEARFIYKNFKLIGAYLIKNKKLDFMYVVPEYKNKRIDRIIEKRVRKEGIYENK